MITVLLAYPPINNLIYSKIEPNQNANIAITSQQYLFNPSQSLVLDSAHTCVYALSLSLTQSLKSQLNVIHHYERSYLDFSSHADVFLAGVYASIYYSALTDDNRNEKSSRAFLDQQSNAARSCYLWLSPALSSIE